MIRFFETQKWPKNPSVYSVSDNYHQQKYTLWKKEEKNWDYIPLAVSVILFSDFP